MSDLQAVGQDYRAGAAFARSVPAELKPHDPAGHAPHPMLQIEIPKPVLAPPDASIQAQVDAQPGIASPGMAAPTVAGPADASPESYLIIHETNAPHDTLATAQALPNVPYFGVIGTLGSEDSIDLYRLTISPGTSAVQFELVSQQQGTLAPMQFSLFDAAGQVVGKWSSGDGPGASPISIELSNPSLGSTLFLGVSTATPGAGGPSGPPPTTAYQLWVTSSNAPDSQPSAATTTSSSPLVVGPLSPSTSPSFPGAASSQSPAATPTAPAPIQPGPAQGLPLAVGGMTTRSASPLGGVLADGDTTQTSVHLLTVTVTVAGSVQDSGNHALDPEDAPSPEGSATLRGPGGFPLLGAVAIGNWHRTPVAIATAPAEPAPVDRIDPSDADVHAVQNVPSRAAGSLAEAEAEAEAGDVASRVRPWGESRVTLSFGLSIATALTLNVVLSDPVAGFDYLATRIDPDGRKSKRVRRPSS